MQYKTFSLAAGSSELAEENLNAFLRSNKIISVSKEFVSAEKCWCFLVEYIAESTSQKISSKIDYMKVLSQEDFAIFSKLRELRKKLATEEKIPAYAVFTDEQLSRIVLEKPSDIQKMQKISGIGEMKAQKYGSAFLKILNPSNPNNLTNSKAKEEGHEPKNVEFDIF